MEYFAFQWHITDSCDQRCKHCYIFSENIHFKTKEMKWDEMQSVFENCMDMCSKANRVPYFYITGGDPILHSRFWDLLELFKANNIGFSILSNPFHLTDEVCRSLKAYGCERYQLSIDGLRETHDTMRKPGSFDITLEKIKVLRDAGIRVAIMTTVSGTNAILTNMSQFEKQAEIAAASSKAAKELKDKQAKEAKEKKEKFDKLIKKAEELESEQKLSEALTNLQQARTLATPQVVKSVDDKIAVIRFKLRQGSLFDEKPEVQTVTMQQPQQTIPLNQPQQPVQTPVITGQPIQQAGASGYTVQNGNVPVGQPLQQPVQQPPQQPPVQQSMNGNGQYMQYQSAINGNQQPQTGQRAAELNFDIEPQPVFTADYSAHREGEYDQYPDFPGYSNNKMYNQ